MLTYILECIAFQLLFLIVYDVFLKQETFFQWNRSYLIVTYFLGLILPLISIAAFQTQVPTAFQGYPEFLWNLDNGMVSLSKNGDSKTGAILEYGVLFGGMVVAFGWFAYKVYQILKLRRNGTVKYFKDFTQIVVHNSSVAFSFFKSIFLGDQITEEEQGNIIRHELVHIRQKHTYDLLFFEMMRILGWFNPLVYVYQRRISELHEFIADAQVAKNNRRDHYQLLLSQLFQTRNISFINQFHTKSLIKKRIVMLRKAKSKPIWKFKYLMLVPLVLGMLFYTSCQEEHSVENNALETYEVGNVKKLTPEEQGQVFTRLIDLSVKPEGDWSLVVKDKNSTVLFTRPQSEHSFITGPGGIPIRAQMQISSRVLDNDFDFFENSAATALQTLMGNKAIPFGTVQQVPIFPGCEDALDPRACFNQKIQRHISKNFRYPDEAKAQGIQGRVNVLFTIAADGSIQNIKKRGPHSLLEDEVGRIISRLPKMSPGLHEGKAVNVPFSIPITFKLQ